MPTIHEGYWWPAGSDDKTAGRLEVGQERIALKLNGRFGPLTRFEGTDYGVVHGQSGSQQITLREAWENASTFGTGLPTQEFVVGSVWLGAHVDAFTPTAAKTAAFADVVTLRISRARRFIAYSSCVSRFSMNDSRIADGTRTLNSSDGEGPSKIDPLLNLPPCSVAPRLLRSACNGTELGGSCPLAATGHVTGARARDFACPTPCGTAQSSHDSV
jgi:hypothetical protein